MKRELTNEKKETNTEINTKPHHMVNDKVNNINNQLNDKVNDLLEYLKLHPDYTVTQLAEYFDVSRKTIAARLKKLKEKGYIKRIGSSRKGYWKIN